jgi:hypothetical protein
MCQEFKRRFMGACILGGFGLKHRAGSSGLAFSFPPHATKGRLMPTCACLPAAEFFNFFSGHGGSIR